MLSSRLIALLLVSIAASPAVTGASQSHPLSPNTTDLLNSTAVDHSVLASGTVKACQTRYYAGACDYITFHENQCINLPSRQVNKVDSVLVPAGWICVFYDGYSCSGPSTTILAPGSDDLATQRFNDCLDFFRCFIR
ncbi:hypothetical protein C8R47DRAFT_1326448 [Mycena vitilis]|nr:hypothetical protein C8R47DRAFT_1326448 [Mycena vitilis]